MKKNNNQKKLKISKLHKKISIMILVSLLLGNIGLIMNEVMKQEITEETQVSSSFSNTPGISYQVYLKENALYTDTVQPEDTGYFSSIIDHIVVTFDNQYQGVDGAEYKGDYTITGELTGWEAGTEEPAPAWMKQLSISSKKTFSTTDDELTLAQDAAIDYNHFNEFVAEVGELTGYNTSYTMEITMVVNYTITTEEGEVTGSLQPSLTIPLGESYFKITKSGIEEKKDDITRTVEVIAPIDYFKIILFSTISLLCLILLGFLISSVEPTLIDGKRKRVRKLLKSHGIRLVAVYDNLVDEVLSVCYVHSMNDMVKISDEIERPILYVFQNDLANIKEFFIIERDKAYLYTVPDPEKSEVSTEFADNAS